MTSLSFCQNYQILGTIINGDTKQPIDSAVIYIFGKGYLKYTHIITDSTGKFQFDSLRAGRYNFHLIHDNFKTGQKGILEIKCPSNSINHLKNLKFDTCQYHKLYKWQIQGYMWITHREYAEFCSFDPRFPFGKQMAVHYIEYDKTAVEELESRLLEFWDIVQDKLSDHI